MDLCLIIFLISLHLGLLRVAQFPVYWAGWQSNHLSHHQIRMAMLILIREGGT